MIRDELRELDEELISINLRLKFIEARTSDLRILKEAVDEELESRDY